MATKLINANPIVYKRKERRIRGSPIDTTKQPIDQLGIFDHIRDIKDPEHPYSLEELKVVTEDSIEVDDNRGHVRVTFTPTVKVCGMAPFIGPCLHAKLMRSLPSRYKVSVRVAPGSHDKEVAVNKQLSDKERVVAAMEGKNLMKAIEDCLAPTFA